jgi:hypothetical protein
MRVIRMRMIRMHTAPVIYPACQETTGGAWRWLRVKKLLKQSEQQAARERTETQISRFQRVVAEELRESGYDVRFGR